MLFTLAYCEKCGHIGDSLLWNAEEKGRFACNTKGTTKLIPREFIDEDGDLITILKQELIEKYIKSSSNFDQECWNRREAFKEIQKYNEELLEKDKIKQTNLPKCPTCSSTNLKKLQLHQRQ